MDKTLEKSAVTFQNFACPPPIYQYDRVILGHGSGGKLSHDLVAQLFFPAFSNPALEAGNDAGIVMTDGSPRLAVTTDSHVVWPLVFPGGDIGRLSVSGTVNDLAMMGATPTCLTAGFILEEGLDLALLQKIILSMKEAAEEAGVFIVAGDTKVVEKGKADGLYINTSGVGTLPPDLKIGGELAQPSDRVILSGPIGDHGIAVLSARGEIGFEAAIESDVAPLNHLVEAMLAASRNLHVLRDPTRGGVATSLNEIARQSQVGIVLDESRIPVRPAVKAACEMLGFDPLYVANEGKLLAVVPEEDSEAVLHAMRVTRYGEEACLIGEVRADPKGRLLLRTVMGSHRIVDVLIGEMLPRIC
jgi:hydrogenase expression/formation protein HypE